MIDRAALLAHPPLEVPYEFGPRDVMRHALATGVGRDPLDATQLRYVYDDPARPLRVLPTFPIVLGWVDLVRDPRSYDAHLGIDPDQVVVGQTVLAIAQLPDVAGHGFARTRFHAVVDKGAGRGALVCVRRDVLDAQRALLATVDTWLFVRGAGGFGGPAEGAPAKQPVPERAPDAVAQHVTPGNMALAYRLSLGDHNAVHADPEHARRTGFARPILHGLATFSLALHDAVVATATDAVSALARVRHASATLTSPVFPGDELRTEAWRDGADLRFRTRVPARDAVVVDGGRAALSAAS